MRRVVLESPWAGDEGRHLQYVRACIRDCLERDESPVASHVMFAASGALDEGTLEDRNKGIAAGDAWMECADAVVFYADLGFSPGMERAYDLALNLRHLDIDIRCLGDGWGD